MTCRMLDKAMLDFLVIVLAMFSLSLPTILLFIDMFLYL